MSKKEKPLALHLISGGVAGFAESLFSFPFDTLKVRMQLGSTIKSENTGVFRTARNILVREGPFAFYKGYGAVGFAIVPKMAIRFYSFELYKKWIPLEGKTKTFLAGLGAGTTESFLVLAPVEVVKIRLQAQRHSLTDPLAVPKYRNAVHACYVILKEEGIRALYNGVLLTSLRQATNQAVNFTVYQEMKKQLQKYQQIDELPSYQHLIAGGISGGIAPMANSPIDIVKTRIQKQGIIKGQSGFESMRRCIVNIFQAEGFFGFYRGLTPRLMRVAPGQAIVFMVYEKVYGALSHHFVEQPSP